ncbi:MAG: DUF4148 domain-containing protein [Paraburkholderia sp.]|uniref:DUF4148 domain-containing protein n=1 Tax=Paraburkholderia sp. TaxID=1926495 RepID=UPI0012201185|nr:DUF4148 domain-containing protein [Paraburkholderia sp.]TAL96603.1 MAG: DUF4148 domain-containing protein [Paraburkholderia sp.]
MKALISSLVVAGALIVPAVSFAQDSYNYPVTRDTVRAQIAQAEQSGELHQSKAHYPQYNRSAYAVASNAAPAGNVDYGPATHGSTQSGQPAGASHSIVGRPLYSAH